MFQLSVPNNASPENQNSGEELLIIERQMHSLLLLDIWSCFGAICFIECEFLHFLWKIGEGRKQINFFQKEEEILKFEMGEENTQQQANANIMISHEP